MMFEDVLWKIKWWLTERGIWRGEGSETAREAYRVYKMTRPGNHPLTRLWAELDRQGRRRAEPELPCGTMLETMWSQLTPADRYLVRKMLRDNPGMTDMEAIAKVQYGDD
jgi:hypothetical protein